MGAIVKVEGILEIPKSVMAEPTREQMTLEIICMENFETEGDETEYLYDADGYTLYAVAHNGLFKVTNDEMTFLHQSKN